MTDSALVGTAAPATERRGFFTGPQSSRDSEGKVYLLLALLIVCGYLWSDWQLINPRSGIGYWFGIVGGSLMLVLLLYPMRKRIRALRVIGSTRAWFQVHMLFGLIGPLLILYHCNFQLGSFNSQVALYSTLLVSGSGIVGRHFYARIHRGLYGRKTSLDEVQADLTQSILNNQGMAAFSPRLVDRLKKMAEELPSRDATESLGVGRSLKWTFTHHFTQASLMLTARRELRIAAKTSGSVARNYEELLNASYKRIRQYTRLVGRVAQFSFYERLFSLWHMLHLPIFFLLVASALFHVLAVHMY